MSSWPHPNVPLGLLAFWLSQLSSSLWFIVDAYILLLPDGVGSNTNVGIVEGVTGVANLVAAMASGITADRFSRVLVMRVSSALSVLAAVTMLIAVLYLPQHSSTQTVYLAIGAAGILTGFFRGSFYVSFEAIFGDCTPQGEERVRYYVWKQAAGTLGLALGPLLAVLCFALTNDSWTQSEMKVVIVVCAATMLIMAGVQLCFQDVHVDSETEGSLLDANTLDSHELPSPGEYADPPAKSTWVTEQVVAPLIGLNCVLIGLGSGITYKYIPLFCLKTLKLSPIATNAIVSGMQIVATVLGFIALRIAKRTGPIILVDVVYMLISITALTIISLSSDLDLSTTTIGAAIVVRGAFINACGGLTSSVLNDHVSDENRAKWSVVSELANCSWSGAAFVGGVMVDNVGYEHSFLVPIGCHSLATICLLPLLMLPNKKSVQHIAPTVQQDKPQEEFVGQVCN